MWKTLVSKSGQETIKVIPITVTSSLSQIGQSWDILVPIGLRPTTSPGQPN